jgi:hypothetical protein
VGNANSSISANLITAVSNIGSGVVNGTWLLDLYPSNTTPVSSTNVAYYTPLTVARFSSTLRNQANYPFSSGMSGFANVYLTTYGYANSVFDIVSSANLLTGKIYAQSGIGYNGPQDLATTGVGNTAPILANAVANFGTMYDITHLNNFGDPYIFGQNLLNQGLGVYGDLANKLKNAGLNISNLSAVPVSNTSTSIQIGSTISQTPVGQISLPYQQTVTTTTVVSGNSIDVLLDIYKSVSGSDLSAILVATQITLPTSTSISTLADLLTLKNVIAPSVYSQLTGLGITDFTKFGSYLQSKVGGGTYSSWSSLSNYLGSIVIPTLNYTTANSKSVMVANTIINSINSTYGTGSGPFNNPVITDYFGAVSGQGYVNNFSLINNNYTSISNTINLTNLLNTLETDILNYNNYTGGASGLKSLLDIINSDIQSINFALNTIPVSTTLTNCNNAFYSSVNKLKTEVNNLSLAGVVVDGGSLSGLRNFAQSFGSLASDTTQFYTYQFFSNLITNDSYGDTIRSVMAEVINTSLSQAQGMNVKNDPNPSLAIFQARAQKIPLSTYISQNK